MEKYTLENLNKTGSYFYNDDNHLLLRKDDLLKLKTVKSTRINSSYIDTVAFWDEDDNPWNSKILSTLLHFCAREMPITDEFIKKYNVEKYHINLIRSMYIDDSETTESVGAMLGYKRPYGNSDVLVDVYDEFIKIKEIPNNDVVVDRYEWIDKEYDFLLSIHNRTMDIFDLMLKELNLCSTEFVSDNNQNWMYKWEPTEKGKIEFRSFFREKKLERILKKKNL